MSAKKIFSAIVAVPILIVLVRFLLDQPPPMLLEFLKMTEGVGTFDPKQVLLECNQIVLDMITISSDGFEQIWADADFLNFLVKLVESVIYLLNGVVNFIAGVFLSSVNLLKIPLQGLLYILSVLYWVFGVRYY